MLDEKTIDRVLIEVTEGYISGGFLSERCNMSRVFTRVYGAYGEPNYLFNKPISLRENLEDKGRNSGRGNNTYNELFWNAYKKYNGIIRRFTDGSLLFTERFLLSVDGCFFCDPAERDSIWNELQDIIPEEKETPSIDYITVSNVGLSTTSLELKNQNDLDLKLNYNDDLDYDRMNEILREERSSLMILHGEPGTGKTTLLRKLIADNMKIDFYWLDSKLLQMSTSKAFFDFILEHREAVYVLEDCEHLLRDREDGQNDLLATVLNLSDGMLGDSLNVKFICTFNAGLEKIDPALLRKGRLRLKYEFKKLTKDKVKALGERLEVELPEKEMPLCDIYNFAEENGAAPKRERIKVGFAN